MWILGQFSFGGGLPFNALLRIGIFVVCVVAAGDVECVSVWWWWKSWGKTSESAFPQEMSRIHSQ